MVQGQRIYNADRALFSSPPLAHSSLACCMSRFRSVNLCGHGSRTKGQGRSSELGCNQQGRKRHTRIMSLLTLFFQCQPFVASSNSRDEPLILLGFQRPPTVDAVLLASRAEIPVDRYHHHCYSVQGAEYMIGGADRLIRQPQSPIINMPLLDVSSILEMGERVWLAGWLISEDGGSGSR